MNAKTKSQLKVLTSHLNCFFHFITAKSGFLLRNGDTDEGLCKFVEENNINIPIVWPYNKVAIEEEGEDDKGNLIFKYIFDFNDFPEDLDLMSYQ